MLANSRIKGFEPDEAHWQLLQHYIEGAVSLNERLTHAYQFAAAVAYSEWFKIGMKHNQTHLRFDRLVMDFPNKAIGQLNAQPKADQT
jgi:hypothetical protein